MNATQVYAMSKKYTDESILGIVGVLAGKNCTIKSHVYKDGVNTIIFQWTADDGTTREEKVEVHDGTPIYDYTPGNTYKYGDLVIYAAQFYRCTTDCIAGQELDDRYFAEIGSPDGNYDIVDDSSQLPPRFTAADRKMYYSIDDGFFWLWDGTKWVEQQPKTISDEDIDELFV